MQITPKAFYIPGLDFILGFARAADGTASKIYVSSNIAEEWGFRATSGAMHTVP